MYLIRRAFSFLALNKRSTTKFTIQGGPVEPPIQDSMSLNSPLAAQNSLLAPSLELLEADLNTSSILNATTVEEASPIAGTLVFQRMSAFFQSLDIITEAEFILSCKKVIALLQLSEPKYLDRPTLVDLVEHAVIAFIVRVFPFAPKEIGLVPSMLTSGLITIMSLLDLVDAHLDEDGDFTFQLRMEANRRLLLDHTEISRLLFWSSSLLFTHTSLPEGIYQSTSFDTYDLSSIAHFNVHPQNLWEVPSLSFDLILSTPNTPLNNTHLSPPSSILHSPGPPIHQATTTDSQYFVSSVFTPKFYLEDILTPDSASISIQTLADLDSASEREPAEINQTETFATCSPLSDPQSLPIASPLVSHFNETSPVYVAPFTENFVFYPQCELQREVLPIQSSPLLSPPCNVLADLSNNNQSNHDAQHERGRVGSYSSTPLGSNWPFAASMHHIVTETRLKYVPDDTPINAVDPEMAALVIEKQSIIRRPRRPRSISNTLPIARTRSRRTRAQARATSLDLWPLPVASPPPPPKPLGVVGGNDVKIAVFHKARKTKARMPREVITTIKPFTTESIYWEVDGPRPKRVRRSKNGASQMNLKSHGKENTVKVEVDSLAYDEV